MGELAKTPAGLARIAAASERLDRTVGELGRQHRGDLAQGEMGELYVPNPHNETPPIQEIPVAVDEPVEFIPMEPRPAETKATTVFAPEPEPPESHGGDVQAQYPYSGGMDVDVVNTRYPRMFGPITMNDDVSPGRRPPTLLTREDDPKLTDDAEDDLRELLAVVTRDVRQEIQRHDEDIIGTIRALGGCEKSYRRERRKAIRAVVAEIYSAEGDRRMQATAGVEAYTRVRAGPHDVRCRRQEVGLQ